MSGCACSKKNSCIHCVKKCDTVRKSPTLTESIAMILNTYCAENESNTPDFILAAYLIDCLSAYNKATKWKNKWNNFLYKKSKKYNLG